MRRQKRRPSEAETRQPLVTFQSSLISSFVDGSSTDSSWRPWGKRPGDRPMAIGDWKPDGERSVRPGEYGRRFITARGIIALEGVDVWVG